MIRETFDGPDDEATRLDPEKIHRGDHLAPGEAVVWQGSPKTGAFLHRVFHVPVIAAYFLILQILNAWQAYVKAMPLQSAIRASLPLLGVSVVALAIFVAFAWFSARTTRYIVTDRRVILKYGIAMPATLSIPFSKIATLSVAVRRDHTGDISLKLTADNHIGYLKLWPHARSWHLKRPQPTLRSVPAGGMVAALMTRAINAAMNGLAVTDQTLERAK